MEGILLRYSDEISPGLQHPALEPSTQEGNGHGQEGHESSQPLLFCDSVIL